MATIILGSEEDIRTREVLKKAISEALAVLWPYLRDERDSDRYRELYNIYEQLTVLYGQLQNQQVAAIAGAVTEDIAAITQATGDLKKFLLAVKKVEKVVNVLIELIGLIGAVMKADIKPVLKAVYDLYQAMNEKAEGEKDKGDKAAVMIAPFALNTIKMRTLLHMNETLLPRKKAKSSVRPTANPSTKAKPKAKARPSARATTTN
jgi:hypothetical protein